jgi:hypothetical protein
VLLQGTAAARRRCCTVLLQGAAGRCCKVLLRGVARCCCEVLLRVVAAKCCEVLLRGVAARHCCCEVLLQGVAWRSCELLLRGVVARCRCEVLLRGYEVLLRPAASVTKTAANACVLFCNNVYRCAQRSLPPLATTVMLVILHHTHKTPHLRVDVLPCNAMLHV